MAKVSRRTFLFGNDSNYNRRYQWYFRHSYKTEPMGGEPKFIQKPEDSPAHDSMLGGNVREYLNRYWPSLQLWLNRSHRISDSFNLYVLPSVIALGVLNWDLALGFKLMALMPATMLYTRSRNKVFDPEVQETFLRDMIHEDKKLGELFRVETTQVMDYDCEYDKGFPDAEEFPEFNNPMFSRLIRILQHRHQYDNRTLRVRRS